jgi:hypothetical protein
MLKNFYRTQKKKQASKSKKIYTFRGPRRAQKRNLGPKISMVVGYVHRLGILQGARKYILLGVKKAKIGTQSPKSDPSIENFTRSKKK